MGVADLPVHIWKDESWIQWKGYHSLLSGRINILPRLPSLARVGLWLQIG